MFSLFSFFIHFPGGQLTPFAPMCGRPWWAALYCEQYHLNSRAGIGKAELRLRFLKLGVSRFDPNTTACRTSVYL